MAKTLKVRAVRDCFIDNCYHRAGEDFYVDPKRNYPKRAVRPLDEGEPTRRHAKDISTSSPFKEPGGEQPPQPSKGKEDDTLLT